MAADMDSDGLPDMVVLNQSTTTMSVLRNDPLKPITGTFTLCAGGSADATTTLSEATPDGTWSSSDASIATVGGSTGIVTGVAAGTATITYSGTSGTGIAGNYTTQTITVNPVPSVSFTAQPGASSCEGTNLTYSTQSGMSSYVWGFPGTSGVDYSIASGGTSGTNSVVVTYFTSGPQTVSINYTDVNGCSAASATSSTATTIQVAPTITALSATTGLPGSALTLTGTNFDATASNNTVWFGSVQGAVTLADGTSLTVTIPNGGVYAPITVETSDCGLAGGYGGSPFFPVFDNTGDVTGTVNFDPRVNFTVGSSANRIGYGDIDGDGKTDIIVNNSGTGTVSVYLNTSTSGSVSFASAVTVITGSSFPGQPVVSDLDGDGKPELVFLSANAPAAVHVYQNTSTPGSISFGTPLVITYFTNANTLAISDIDGDGKADIIGNFLTTMSVFRNTSTIGSLSFASRIDFSAPGNINSIAAGDIDGDQKPDVLISTSNSTSSLSVFRNTSTPGSISLAARQDFTTTTGNGNYVAVADIDGDGKQDVLTINQGAGSFSLFPNTSSTGSISLGTRVDYTVGPNPNSLFVADFDGDGKADVAAASASGSHVLVFRNTSSSGSFSFASSITFTSGSGAASIVAADMDNDGLPDMVVLNQSTTTMSVFRNDPLKPITGTFTVCGGGSTDATTTLSEATPNGTWSSSDASIASVGPSTGIVTGVAAGTATITYSGTAGTGIAGNYTTQTITVNAVPVMSVTPSSQSVCNNASSATVSFSADVSGTTYSWTNSDATIGIGASGTGSYITSFIATNGGATATNGLITVTPAVNGCTGSAQTFIITVNPTPTVGSTGGGTAICSGGTAVLSGTGATGYSWTGGVTDGVVFTPSVGVNAYTVTGTDINSCSNTAIATITVNALPTVGTTGGDMTICSGVTATLSGTGAVSYSWTGGITNEVAFTPAVGVNTYTVTGTDINTCANTATATITINAVPTVGTSGGGVAICTGATATLSGTGASSYSWTGSVTNGVAFTPSVGINSYTVTGTTAGCSNTATTTITVNATATGTITGASTVTIGSNISLTDVISGGTWSASNGNATVAGGVVSGVTAGTVVISYSVTGICGAASATKLITVGTGTVSVTAISGYEFYLCTGSTTSFWDATPGGVWSMSSAGVASVSATGVVSGISSGTATLSYTAGSSSATAVITVYPVPLAVTGNASVCESATTTFSDVTPGGVWSSSIASVASVGTSGIVTANVPGTASIYYTLVAPAGCRSAFIVTVNPNPSGITGPPSVCTGASISLSDATAGGAWSTASGSATVDGSGHVLGISAGSATITYALATGCSKTYGITINTLSAGSISGALSVTVGSTIVLTDGTSGGTWSASNSNATVSATGVVTGLAAGTVTISYTVTNGCGSITATDMITVNASGVGGVSGAPTVCLLSTTTLTDATPGGTWHSSNTLIATVGTSGIVTGVAAGTAKISYTVAGVPTVVTVTVNPVPNGISGATSVCDGASITLNDITVGGAWTSTAGVSVTTGSTVTTLTTNSLGTSTVTYSLPTGCYKTLNVTVKALPTDILGNLSVCGASGVTYLTDATAGSSWTISPVGTATVSGSGRVYGVSPGTATVSYTATNTCITTAIVTVNALVTLPAISGAANVGHDLIITLSDATPGGTWSSSNAALGSGDATGDVTGVGTSGTVTITYALSYAAGTCTATATKAITVHTPAPPAHGTTVGGLVAVSVGAAINLDDDAENGTWSSSNIDVATADGGLITGVAPGNANIIHTVTNSNGDVSTSVTPVVVSATPMDVRIVPNPNNGTFSVKGVMGTTQDAEVTLEVTDVLGQVIYNSKLIAADGRISEVISLNKTLANGMYMMNIRTATEQSVFHFVIEK